MRTTIVVIVAVLGLIGSTSVGTAQEKSEKKGTKWQGLLFCDENRGKGPFSITLYDDSTYESEFSHKCPGFKVYGRSKGKYKLVGSDFSYETTGYAKTDLGPDFRSRFKSKGSGKLLEKTASATYKVSFDNFDWPSELTGRWEVEKVK